MSVGRVLSTGMVVAWMTAIAGPVEAGGGSEIPTFEKDGHYQIVGSRSSKTCNSACFEALARDVKWVAAYGQERKAEASDKLERDKRLAQRIAALQEKAAEVGTVAGALKQARELLDLAFRLKARALSDRPANPDLKRAIERAEEPLERLKAAVQGGTQLSDAQAIADLHLATERIVAVAFGLPVENPEPITPDPPNRCNETSVWCFGLVGSGTQQQDKGERRVTNARLYLVDAYAVAKRLSCPTDQLDCTKAQHLLRRELRDALDTEGLRPLVTATLKPGFGVGKVENDSKPLESLVARFATRTTGSGFPVSVGLLGHLGVEPTLDLLKTEPAANFSDTQTNVVQVARDGSFTVRTDLSRLTLRKCTEDKAGRPEEWSKCPLVDADAAVYTPTLQRAFVWDVGGRISAPLAESVAISVVGRLGMTLRTTDFAAAKRKVKDAAGQEFEEEVIAGQVVGEQGDSNWYYDLGAQFQLFDRTLGAREAGDLALRRTVLSIEAGCRWDRRFRNNPVLAAAPKTYGDEPQRRWFFRFALDRVPVFVDGGKEGGKPDVYLSFAVEHEGRFRALGLPSTTRVYVQGNLGFKL